VFVGGGLAGAKLAEIDDVLDEEILDFERQAHIMQPGIVGAEDYIYTGFRLPRTGRKRF
jgi:hypothetical protein